ncbi:hypothetical protein GE21DRAFT_1278231 [Neurospora crassa]|nr:hypothetical protein GE21DRAFT_1278231 [Neurospora crassa]
MTYKPPHGITRRVKLETFENSIRASKCLLDLARARLRLQSNLRIWHLSHEDLRRTRHCRYILVFGAARRTLPYRCKAGFWVVMCRAGFWVVARQYLGISLEFGLAVSFLIIRIL